MKDNTEDKQRISKVLAQAGVCSRREAEQLIEKGWLKINGDKITSQGIKISSSDQWEILPQGKKWLNSKKTIILNKPPGFVSGQAEKGYKPAIRLITKSNYSGASPPPSLKTEGLAPAGRLDIDSTGLLILTQDGTFARKIIGSNSNVEKEYHVRIKGNITQEKIQKLKHGLKLDGKKLKKAKVKKVGPDTLNFILTEGKKRQIRRMCELVDLEVIRLKRVRIGQIKLARLPRGQWRFLRADESLD